MLRVIVSGTDVLWKVGRTTVVWASLIYAVGCQYLNVSVAKNCSSIVVSVGDRETS